MSGLSENFAQSLQLDNIEDGFCYERRFEFFFDVWIIGSMKLSELVGNFDDK